MRQVTLREFRTRGLKALDPDGGRGVVVLCNRQGPAFFLVTVQPGDLEAQGRELLRAQAKASLRAWQLQAKVLGMDQMSDEDIEAEINASRKDRRAARVTGNPKDYPVEIRQGTNLFNAREFLERYRSRD